MASIRSTLAASASASSTGRAVAAVQRIDLSHLPHLSSDILARAINEYAFRAVQSATAGIKYQETQHDDALHLVLDVSYSNLGDEGLNGIWEGLLRADNPANVTNVRSSSSTISLCAQGNRITPRGASAFVWSILRPRQHKMQINTGATTAISTAAAATNSILLESLDLGFHRFFNDETDRDDVDSAAFSKAVTALLASVQCPSTLLLECIGATPAFGRAIGQGLLSRRRQRRTWVQPTQTTRKTTSNSNNGYRTQPTKSSLLPPHPLSLSLACNPDLQDAGVAAIAAALRSMVHDDDDDNNNSATISTSTSAAVTILQRLDLSSCNIGDAGVHALALALEDADPCTTLIVDQLILKHNIQITDAGALSLGLSLLQQQQQQNHTTATSMTVLDLSGNIKITDRGIATLLEAVRTGRLSTLLLQSCHIHADGAEAVGRMIATLGPATVAVPAIHVDLSGNPLGILRGKSKSSDKNKYSASALKSKARATATAYMNQGLSFFKGLSDGLNGGDNSDDDIDPETKSNNKDVSLSKKDPTSDHQRCGFKAMANAFLENKQATTTASIARQDNQKQKETHSPIKVRLSLRRTFCDTAGAEALAAMVLAARERGNIDLELDLDLNPVVEDDMIEALVSGNNINDELLHEMAERHLHATEIIRQSQERAARAARLAATRLQREAVLDDDDEEWGGPTSVPDILDHYDGEEEEEQEFAQDQESNVWDSDADYENEEDDY
jgi:Leucine Rich repeat